MPELRKLSGHEVVKALSKAGFKPKRQRGSHLILIKETLEGKVGRVVPTHPELKIGTINGDFGASETEQRRFHETVRIAL